MIHKTTVGILCGLILSGCSNVGYILDAGVGQWRIMNRARPVQQVMQSPNTDAATKKAILIVQEAKRFAVESMQLNATANYRDFVQLDEEYPTYVVTASHPLDLEPLKWSFPIVGEFPYIGFFAEAKAKTFADAIVRDPDELFQVGTKQIPPDVHVRGAPAYSTLGWFADPIFSSMVRTSERRLVDLIIHESVHATVFIGSNVEFNERLANFVGLEGSLFFLRKKYGLGSPELEAALAALAAQRHFSDFIDAASAEYKEKVSNDWQANPVAALAAKDLFYASLPERYETLWKDTGTKYFGVTPTKWKFDFTQWNNAVLNGHRVYHADFGALDFLYKACDSDIRRFIRWIVTEYQANESEFAKSPDEYLEKNLRSKSCPNLSQ